MITARRRLHSAKVLIQYTVLPLWRTTVFLTFCRQGVRGLDKLESRYRVELLGFRVCATAPRQWHSLSEALTMSTVRRQTPGDKYKPLLSPTVAKQLRKSHHMPSSRQNSYFSAAAKLPASPITPDPACRRKLMCQAQARARVSREESAGKHSNSNYLDLAVVTVVVICTY